MIRVKTQNTNANTNAKPQRLIVLAPNKDLITDSSGKIDVNDIIQAYAECSKDKSSSEHVHATYEDDTVNILTHLGFEPSAISAYRSFAMGNHDSKTIEAIKTMGRHASQLIDKDYIGVVFNEDNDIPEFKMSWWVNEQAFYVDAKVVDQHVNKIDVSTTNENNPYLLDSISVIVVVGHNGHHYLITKQTLKFHLADIHGTDTKALDEATIDDEFSKLINLNIDEMYQASDDLYYVTAEYSA